MNGANVIKNIFTRRLLCDVKKAIENTLVERFLYAMRKNTPKRIFLRRRRSVA